MRRRQGTIAQRHRSQQTPVQIKALLPTSCVNMGMFIGLSEPVSSTVKKEVMATF